MSLMRNNGKQGVDSHCPHSAAWPAANGMSVIREMNVEVNFAIFRNRHREDSLMRMRIMIPVTDGDTSVEERLYSSLPPGSLIRLLEVGITANIGDITDGSNIAKTLGLSTVFMCIQPLLTTYQTRRTC